MTHQPPRSVLEEFDAAVRRTLDSTYQDAQQNVKRLVGIIRRTPDLAAIIAEAPTPPQATALQLVNAFYYEHFELPTDPDEELGVVYQLLSTIADNDETEFGNYVWLGRDIGEAGPREFMSRFVSHALAYLRALLAKKYEERQSRELFLASVSLEDEQRQLLSLLVEASRSVPRDKRQPFRWTPAKAYIGQTTEATVSHPGLPRGKLGAYDGDISALAREGLIAVSRDAGDSKLFDLRPKGVKYYEYAEAASSEPLAEVEDSVRSYLNGAQFTRRYAAAYGRWLAAERRLRAEDWATSLTEIGHACREAMQEFADALATSAHLEVDPDRRNTVARGRTVLNAGPHLGKDEKAFLDALTVYWGTVADLSQRQEHGAGKEGEELMWEDARRLVFHTALVMYEIDRAVARAPNEAVSHA